MEDKTTEDYFQSRFLKAENIQGEEPVTISKVEEAEVGDDIKPVVYFQELQKGLVLNRTNAAKITQILGTNRFSGWIGKRIVLCTALVVYKKEEVPAIRVKPFREAGEKPATRSLVDIAIEKAMREERYIHCAICGKFNDIIWHHLVYRPEKTIPLCRHCHLIVHRTDRYPNLKPNMQAEAEWLHKFKLWMNLTPRGIEAQ